MLRLPIYDALENAQSVLIIGAGGGFDVFSGLPLFFGLRNLGKEVHLANLAFTHLSGTQAKALGWGVHEVQPDTAGTDGYFPEKHLARWLADHGEPQPIYGIDRSGVVQLREAYRLLHQRLEFDTLIVVDGGTDSLMRGDEAGLGTPAEDIASILAGEALDVPSKLLVCLGFGIDRFHGVCHAQFLEAVADLTRTGEFLGALTLTDTMPEVRSFLDCVNYVQGHTPGRESIVCASIASALAGAYGDHHRLTRTRNTGSKLWINPLMAIYWAFGLDAVAARILYRSEIEDSDSLWDINARIEAFRKSVKIRDWEEIPV